MRAENIKGHWVYSLQEDFIVLDSSSVQDTIEKILKLMEPICKDYPKHKDWFLKKHIPEVESSDVNDDRRDVLYICNPHDSMEVIGISCVKNTETEKKLCCLYVDEKWRNKGFGTILLEQSFKYLGTDEPLITFPDYKFDEMTPFIVRYGWELVETLNNPYSNGHKELCFNGRLVKDPELEGKQNTNQTLKFINNDNNKKSAE